MLIMLLLLLFLYIDNELGKSSNWANPRYKPVKSVTVADVMVV